MSSNAEKPQASGVIGALAKQDAVKADASKRRVSGGAATGKFSGLQHQKRGSLDADAAARRASIQDQTKQTFAGGLWSKITGRG